jgi:hypothetical protein
MIKGFKLTVTANQALSFTGLVGAFLLSLCFSSNVFATTDAWRSWSETFGETEDCMACHTQSYTNSLITNFNERGDITITSDVASLVIDLDVSVSGSGRFLITEINNTTPLADTSIPFRQDLHTLDNLTIPLHPNRRQFHLKFCVGQNIHGVSLGPGTPRQIECGTVTVTRDPPPVVVEPPPSSICTTFPALCLAPIDPCRINPDSCITVPITENRDPIAQPDTFDISADIETIVLDVLNNDADPDGDAIRILLDGTTTSLGGTLALFSNAATYQPPVLLSQPDSFTYQVVDSNGNYSAFVPVTLIPVDTDGDGITDTIDNCDLQDNIGQLDSDGDSIGDICDGDPDGDGIPGLLGDTFNSGRDLADAECLSCHLIGTAGAPLFDDAEEWQRLLDLRGVEGLLASVTNGIAPVMPAFGEFYTARELTEAIRYLTGIEGIENRGGPGGDLDLDGVINSLDNCPLVSNLSQIDSNGNGIGNVCEADADVDRDGYRFDIDDNDNDANRMPAQSNDLARSTYFVSSHPMRLGSLASWIYENNDYRDGAIILSDVDFLAAAARSFVGGDPVVESELVSASGIINLEIYEVTHSAEVIIEMFGGLPLESDLRLYQPAEASWRSFDVTGTDQLTAAPRTGGACPAASSPSYSNELRAGLSCIKLTVADAGPNDSDNQLNGAVSLVANITSGRTSTGRISPPIVDLTPSSSGGATNLGLLILLLVFIRKRVAVLLMNSDSALANPFPQPNKEQ